MIAHSFVQYVYAAQLEQALRSVPRQSHMEEILQIALNENRQCVGERCKKEAKLVRHLTEAPHIYALDVVWKTAEPSVNGLMKFAGFR
jgi:hypothetical protein